MSTNGPTIEVRLVDGRAWVDAVGLFDVLDHDADQHRTHHDEVLGRAKADALEETAAHLERVIEVARRHLRARPRRRWWHR